MRFLLLVVTFVCFSGCGMSPALWRSHPRDHMTFVDQSQTSAEALEAAGLSYVIARDGSGFLVEKSAWEETQVFITKVVLTPVAAVGDGAMVSLAVTGWMLVSPAFWYGAAGAYGQ